MYISYEINKNGSIVINFNGRYMVYYFMSLNQAKKQARHDFGLRYKRLNWVRY